METTVARSLRTEVYLGTPGASYEFLVLATDVSGNKEAIPFGSGAADDGSRPNLGQTPQVPSTTPPNFGIPTKPAVDPPVNDLFVEASLGIPAAPSAGCLAEFQMVLQPFTAECFATGIEQSHGAIGPMAVVEAPDGMIIVSGGTARDELYRFEKFGGDAGDPWVKLEYPSLIWRLILKVDFGGRPEAVRLSSSIATAARLSRPTVTADPDSETD